MLEVQKARILPIVDIDMGYVQKPNAQGQLKPYFDISLSNEGAGIAHIQNVSILKNGELIESYKAFDESIMTGRMRSWSTLTATSAAGFLRAGETTTPVSYRLGATESDLPAYLRGEWGTPLEGLDMSICYCSVFEDCWNIKFLDRKIPQPVEHCGIEDQVFDSFTQFIDQRFAERQKTD